MKKFYTSESVTEGHPDKMCDQISDAILDNIISRDKDARVACETFATTGVIFVMGEITTSTYVDIQKVVRETVEEIGYLGSDVGFDSKTCAVITQINEQSPDISMGVSRAMENKEHSNDKYDQIGAGDQGMVFGYATNETEEYMPLPLVLSHKLSKKLAEARKSGEISFLRPDGKSQVTIEYDDNKPVRIDNVVVSSQHDPVERELLIKEIKEKIILDILPEELIDENTKYFINPTGNFEIGGPAGDTGLTGRKIIVDTYGGFSKHGGGAFSGKDPTKVDRSASYYARYVAKNLVAAGLADRMEIGVSYAIGVAKPTSIYVETFGTGKISDDEIIEIIKKEFDFRPLAIIEALDLRRPIYKQTASYGHFGRNDLDLTWERLDKVDKIKKYP